MSASGAANMNPASSSSDLESGLWELSNSKLKPMLKARIHSGKIQLGSLLQQLDYIFVTGALFLKRNSTAKLWALIYLVCLHFWVFYILLSHSSPSNEGRSGAQISLENINNTGGVWLCCDVSSLMSFPAVFRRPSIHWICFVLRQSISYHAPAVDMQECQYQTMTSKIQDCMAFYINEFYISLTLWNFIGQGETPLKRSNVLPFCIWQNGLFGIEFWMLWSNDKKFS